LRQERRTFEKGGSQRFRRHYLAIRPLSLPA
jgi:hypothetical protein